MRVHMPFQASLPVRRLRHFSRDCVEGRMAGWASVFCAVDERYRGERPASPRPRRLFSTWCRVWGRGEQASLRVAAVAVASSALLDLIMVMAPRSGLCKCKQKKDTPSAVRRYTRGGRARVRRRTASRRKLAFDYICTNQRYQ